MIREALYLYDINNNIEIGSFADIPTSGTGLGSSSTFSVALIGALKKIKGIPFSSRDLAEEACHLEIDICGENIGKQDQYAAAFGGLNFYEIENSGLIKVSKNLISRNSERKLEDRLYLVNTGIKRNASSILKHQIDSIENSKKALGNQKKLVDMAYQAYELLIKDKLDDFGKLLHESWLCKKSVSNMISDSNLDSLYTKGINSGALGGKLLGAGGGGFFLFYVPDLNKKKFEAAFKNEFKQISISQEGFLIDYET